MRWLFLLTLVLVWSACSDPLLSTRRGDSDLVLVNRTSSPLLYLAMEREASNRVDPNPSWRVADHLDRLVEPGEERGVVVQEYTRGKDVRLFLYRVPDTEEGRAGEAPLVGIRTFTHEDLVRSNFRMVIHGLP